MVQTVLFIGILAAMAIAYHVHVDRLKRVNRDLLRKLRQFSEELDASQAEIARLSTTDALTGVANYGRFEDFLALEWRRAQRDQTPLSLLLVDIDRFQAFNDQFGRKVGDEFLKEVARLLHDGFRRSSDIVARSDSDQFAVALGRTDATQSVTLAERVRSVIESLKLGSPTSPAHATVSVGIATALPPRQSDWAELELLRAADHALESAKVEGGNRVCRAELTAGDAKG